MEKILVDLENCYGIKTLKYEFTMSNGKAFLIYAPNGSMKTSFAKVFEDVSNGNNPSDILFPHRPSKYSLLDGANNTISPNRIFVVKSYQEGFESTRTATLLANQELRSQYEIAVETINKQVDRVCNKLSKVSQIEKGIQKELTFSFSYKETEIFDLLEHIALTLSKESNPGLENISYPEVFNDKVLAFLSSALIRQQLQVYVERYNELISKSVYFRRGLFDHNNAANISKSLKDNGFFAANHSVLLNGQNSQKAEVGSQTELDRVIATEKQQILNDPELSKMFETIDKAITRNIELRQFRSYLENNPVLLPELADMERLRRRLWISYCFAASMEFAEYLSIYQTAKQEIVSVVEKAKNEETEWRKVVSIFKDRFSVPFSIEIVNQDDVILKNVAPSLVFKYIDGDDTREIGRKELISALSTGESRALYLLDIIFEILSRAKESEDTILVLDDIADSFDYKNKYAIVEYIKFILGTNKFIMLILTHNFDFFRTIQKRLNIDLKNNCLISYKSNEGIVLKPSDYLIPLNHWRDVLRANNPICPQIGCNPIRCRRRRNCSQKILIATIPMVRNLIEYMHGGKSQDFQLLTSLLHIKANSTNITVGKLVRVFNKVLSSNIPETPEKVIKIILNQASLCATDTESINLENKIILSIAIRLMAEKLMITKINSPEITNRISSNQTRELYNLFQEKFPGDDASIALLDRVILMTPEAIHLNSFMYEPILDMSDWHLKSLYNDLMSSTAGDWVKAL
ncbi:MAG: AAA family ATPase [Bellilinea sp.]